MSNTFRLIPLFVIFIAAMSFVSCKNNLVDTQAPKLVILQPSQNQSFPFGERFLVVTTMQDFVELGNYTYKVRWHDVPSNVSDNPDEPAWELEGTGEIENTNLQTVSWHIQVPENTRTGIYKLDIFLYDKAGNVDNNSVLIQITSD
ncbi:MAG: DUF4625 domain-containing protein [Balneolales bacterium]|nr:DUF4625 domain-containing protein [Balneolales bacterium]